MYRFRSIDNLLGRYKELEKQEIYFASPDELNDPIEGFLDIFWQGDAIVWKNFFKHYLLCLKQVCLLVVLSNDNEIIDGKDIPIHSPYPKKPTKERTAITDELLEKFLKEPIIEDLLQELSNRKTQIRRPELLQYFKIIHVQAIDSITNIFSKYELIIIPKQKQRFSSIFRKKFKLQEIFSQMERLKKEYKHVPSINDALFSATKNVGMQLDLIDSYRRKNDDTPDKLNFIYKDFVESYLEKIEELMYPQWYTACFMSECTNSSVWGNYGDNHKGVCLIFKAHKTDDELKLNLRTTYGWNESGAQVGMRPHAFHKVSYESKHVQIDFFKSLGRLPVHSLEYQWYTNEKGDLSNCSEPIQYPQDSWHQKYWNNFYLGITSKLKDWDYEKEYRLIVNDMLYGYSDKKNRVLKYDFNDLEGLIFGIKTSKSDKIKIIEIIKEKCKLNNRKKFNFHQAFYDNKKGKIEYQKLDMLRI